MTRIMILSLGTLLTALTACTVTPSGDGNSGNNGGGSGGEGGAGGDAGEVYVAGDSRCPVELSGNNFGSLEFEQGTVLRTVEVSYRNANSEVCEDLVLTGNIATGDRWSVEAVGSSTVTPGGFSTMIVGIETDNPDDVETLSAAGILEVSENLTGPLDATLFKAEVTDTDDTGGGSSGTPRTWYPDTDGDGYGDIDSDPDSDGSPGVTTSDGEMPEEGEYTDGDGNPIVDWELSSGDCDDTDPSAHPGAVEVCDGIDNDCDGDIDEGELLNWYPDTDGDSYGDTAGLVEACSDPGGYVLTGGDCDDTESAANPGATEVCDGIDNDCDGTVDEFTLSTWYQDSDGDGYGDSSSAVDACSDPGGYVLTGGDCDDTEAAANPGASETCDGIDNDCDTLVDADDSDVLDAYSWYTDSDGDGYGDPATEVIDCEAPSGGVSDGTDCDDSDEFVYPGADEVCNGLDDDCDTLVDDDDPGVLDMDSWYTDSDSDGYGDSSSPVEACTQPSNAVDDDTDCDDGDSTVYPGATDTWYDGVDSDCAGDDDYDADADGDRDWSYGGTDCEDTEPTIDGSTTVYVEVDISYGADALADSSQVCADANGYTMPDGTTGITWTVCDGTMRYSCNMDDVTINSVTVDSVSWSWDSGPDHTTCYSGRTWGGGSVPTAATCMDLSTFF